MKSWHTGVLVAATVTSGLMAGLFAAFSYSVMPGLKRSDDRAFVEVMRNINTVIVNPVFMTCFMGGLVFATVATVVTWRSDDRAFRAWVIAGFACYLAMFVITVGFNVPLNDKLAAAGNPRRAEDLAAIRDAFENRWIAWNIARAIANLASFASFTWAMFLAGRNVRQVTPETRPLIAAYQSRV